MIKHTIMLADGVEISSGVPGENAIAKVTITQSVNDGQDLRPGSVCADVLEAEILTPGGNLHIPVGSDLTLYKEKEEGGAEQIGVFMVDKALRPSPNRYIITARDRLCWLDKDLSEWLESLDGWPYSLQNFAQMVCAACDLVLAGGYFTNGEWPVQKFSASKVTGRQLMQWVGEASCRFCRAKPDGEIYLDWYKESDVSLGADKHIFMDSLSVADYLTEPIDKVQIRTDAKDVGVVYGGGSNAYVITGNPLLACYYQESIWEAARVLYEKLFPVRYNPCKVTVSVDAGVNCGDILRIRDRNYREVLMYVMKKTRCGQKDILECTGNPDRSSRSTQNNYTIEEMQSKVLELEKGIDGIWAENRDNSGLSASVQLSVEGLKTKAADTSDLDEHYSATEQRADGISLQIKNVYDDGVNQVSTTADYRFNEEGFSVSKSSVRLETQITEDGITVYKNNNDVLKADSQGVYAVDLHATTHLSVADRCRFEKYNSSRIGCFWTGG